MVKIVTLAAVMAVITNEMQCIHGYLEQLKLNGFVAVTAISELTILIFSH